MKNQNFWCCIETIIKTVDDFLSDLITVGVLGLIVWPFAII